MHRDLFVTMARLGLIFVPRLKFSAPLPHFTPIPGERIGKSGVARIKRLAARKRRRQAARRGR